MATIATHNGSKVHREHNVRNPKVAAKEAHIKPDGVHEVWHDEKIRNAYSRLFGEAVKKYNAKQEREERKIKDYYKNIRDDSKKHLAYEMIVGVYGSDCTKEQGKAILKEFADGWEERNPNLELIGVYYHADEQGGPHIHIDYIPVGHNYVRGLETQNGLNKALEEMGFDTISKKHTAQMAWEKRENLFLEQLCKNRGITVERPTEAQKEHLDTEVYKATQEAEKAKNAAEKASEALQEMQRELQHTKEQLKPIKAEYAAKTEYIKNFNGEFMGTYERVKEKKTITGKTKSYDVPAAVWETQRLYQADIVAHGAAREAWDNIVTDYNTTKVENESLRQENIKLRNIIDRVDATLLEVSQNVREAFLSLFSAQEVQEHQEQENALKTHQNAYNDEYDAEER